MPIDLSFAEIEGHDAPLPVVELADLAGESWDAPFFRTVRRRERSAVKGHAPNLVAVDVYARWAVEQGTARQPRAVIVSSGRAGSTLLASLLGAWPHALVLSEPQPLMTPLELIQSLDPLQFDPAGLGELARRLGREALASLFGVLASTVFRPTDPRHSELVVKGTLAAVTELPVLSATCPDTSVIAVRRSPHAVAASYVRSPNSAFVERSGRPAGVLVGHLPSMRLEDPERPMTTADLGAHAWLSAEGSLQTLSTRGEGAVTTIDFEDLAADPLGTVTALADSLGWSVDHEVEEIVRGRSSVHAKSGSPLTPPSDSPREVAASVDRVLDLVR